jgi:glycine oxidase
MGQMTRPHDVFDVAICGGGLIALSTALHARTAGFGVVVIGTDTPGIASLAAAGMLTPACEYDSWLPRSWFDLLEAGRRYYPEFLRWAFPGGATDVGYRPSDFLLMDLREGSLDRNERTRLFEALEIECAELDAGQVCSLEPQVHHDAIRGGVLIKNQGLVNPRLLRAAMEARARTLGCEVALDLVSAIESRGGRYELTLASGRGIRAKTLVIASGAWSRDVGALLGLDVPTCPVKGQMLELTGPPNLISTVLFMPVGGCGSILERSPGHYIAGTSEEYTNPSPSNSVAVVGRILQRIQEVLSGAGALTIRAMWSGFRPMLPDELPMIGPVAGENIIVATGHHRNGVLLAPLTGLVVTQLLQDERPSVDLSRFAYGREFRKHARFAAKF